MQREQKAFAKFGTAFTGRFPIDGVGRVAVKGLIRGIVLQIGAQSPTANTEAFYVIFCIICILDFSPV